ncbi:MAG: ribosome hibernation-promoting factor, HPF/YfiA family, partial [Christensenellales bacterium]
MKLIISGKGYEITDGLKERLNKKLARLDKYFHEDAEAYVRLSQERGGRNIVEITISVGGLILRAEEVTGDMFSSIDGVVDKLNRQIRRHRTKVEKKLHVTIDPVPAGEESADEELADYNIVRLKRFPVKPMRVDDAIAQMELLDHAFYLFLNEESDSMCVLYKR